MEILLVDDSTLQLDVLRERVDWAALGISRVYCVTNAADARALLTEKRPPLALCDIEMPQGDGLALLRWIRDSALPTEVAFLTCHASFRYIQEAMRLGCREYLLKSAPQSDLNDMLRKMIARAQSADSVRQTERERRAALTGRFWEEVALRRITGGGIAETIAQWRLDVPKDQPMTLLCCFIKVNNAQEQWDGDTLLFAMRGLCLEALDARVPPPHVWLCEGRLAAVFPSPDMSAEALTGWMERFEARALERLGCKVVCYYQTNLPLTALGERFADIQFCDEYNTFYSSGVFTYDAMDLFIREHSDEIVEPDYDKLLRLYSALSFEQAYDYLYMWLRTMAAQHRVNRASLLSLQRTLSHILTFLRDHFKLALKALEGDKQYIETYSRAARDAKSMIRYLRCLTNHLERLGERDYEPDSITGKIKAYVNTHYADELSVDRITGAANVSQEHAMRTFKADTGMTIGEYLTRVRMEKAKVLLMIRSYSISQVAALCGFNSAAYFTKLFREYAGVKPTEYRGSAG